MLLLQKIRNKLLSARIQADTAPREAYDLWAAQYDAQPGNLMLDLDETLFTELLGKVMITGKEVIDIGCGTGRHWNKLQTLKPRQITGYDVSTGMLQKLLEKYPQAKVFQLFGNKLAGTDNESCDAIVSTLTIAHIEHITDALLEWRRVLKPGGCAIITDYHPEALAAGADRTFVFANKTIAIKNYVHDLQSLFRSLASMGFEVSHFQQRIVDDAVKHYYEQRNALHVYNKFRNVPIIYGMILTKNDAAT